MVLSLKRWKSRSPPGIAACARHERYEPIHNTSRPNGPVAPALKAGAFASLQDNTSVAGWSSPVARQAHNLKVTGSNPVPATNNNRKSPARKTAGLSRLKMISCAMPIMRDRPHLQSASRLRVTAPHTIHNPRHPPNSRPCRRRYPRDSSRPRSAARIWRACSRAGARPGGGAVRRLEREAVRR